MAFFLRHFRSLHQWRHRGMASNPNRMGRIRRLIHLAHTFKKHDALPATVFNEFLSAHFFQLWLNNCQQFWVSCTEKNPWSHSSLPLPRSLSITRLWDGLPHGYNNPPSKSSNVSWKVSTTCFVQLSSLESSLLLSCFMFTGSGRLLSSWHQSKHPGMTHFCFHVRIRWKVQSPLECSGEGGRRREEKGNWHETGTRPSEKERGNATDVKARNLEMTAQKQMSCSKPWQSRAHFPEKAARLRSAHIKEWSSGRPGTVWTCSSHHTASLHL